MRSEECYARSETLQDEQHKKHGKKIKTSKTTIDVATAFALPPLNSTKTNKIYHSL